MGQDKFEDDRLTFLSLRDREILERLCEVELRTPEDEIRYLIRSRAFGVDPIRPLISEDDLTDVVEAKDLSVRRVGARSEEPRGRAPHRPPER